MNKNVIWTKNHKIKEISIFLDEKATVKQELGLQLNFMKYNENIINPNINVDIIFEDVHGLINKLPIRSGDAILVRFSHPSQDDEVELKLIITNIKAHTIVSKKELFTMTCKSIGALNNHTTRVTKKYTGNIGDTVKDIVKEKIGEDIVNSDKVANECEFFGNYRRPFKCIADLLRKSISTTVDKSGANNGSAGFLFYETFDGYNFKSIDTIFSGDPIGDPYIMTAFKAGFDVSNNFKLASDPLFTESHDIIKKLRAGSYSTANWYYDIITRKVHFNNFKYNQNVKKANEDELTPLSFKEPYSRVILGTLDKGTTTTDTDGKGLNTPQDQMRLHAQTSARYSALFSQMLDITVPMNLSLRVGTMIKLKFPDLNIDSKKSKNSPESGNYMIARLSHEFGNPAGDFTGLTLVRDSFTIHE
tara:strand:- start:3846 stop:5099 length:1254 start_codon:yes stop_codon:yes gene_type:complete